MPKQVPVNPERLLSVRLAVCVLLQHKLGTNPAIFGNDLLRVRQERIPPVLDVTRDLHLMPIAVKIPFARRGPATPIAPRFERGGKAFVAGGAETRAAKAAPFVPAVQSLV